MVQKIQDNLKQVYEMAIAGYESAIAYAEDKMCEYYGLFDNELFDKYEAEARHAEEMIEILTKEL